MSPAIFKTFSLPTPADPANVKFVPADLPASPPAPPGDGEQPAPSPPSPQVEQDPRVALWSKKLEAWAAGTELVQADARELRTALAAMLKGAINRPALRIPDQEIKATWLSIAGARNNPVAGRVLVVCDRYEDEDATLREGFLGALRFGFNGHRWNYPEADLDYVASAAIVDRLVAQLVPMLVAEAHAQPDPDLSIIDELLGLLPAGANFELFAVAPAPQPVPASATTVERADEAFDDGQFDRAFEFYLRLPASRKTISRLVSCVGTIGTDEARDRLLGIVDAADNDLVESLAPAVARRVQSLRQGQVVRTAPPSHAEVAPIGANGWMRWAEQLQAGQNLATAEREAQFAPTNWDASEIRESGQLAHKFADIIGGLNGDASAVARAAVPQIYASFFPDDEKASPATRPIASLLFLLIAMDETLSRADLDLLGQLSSLLIEQGLSSDDYVLLMSDLEDVQKRIGSYAYLPWSLDVSEALAVLPCPSDESRDARLRLFLLLLGQAAGFAHRLAAADLLPIETLAKDYGVGAEAVNTLKREATTDEAGAAVVPDLSGKTIGIYTLAEAAGSRAKVALEELFPGCKVVVNSDLVATAQLGTLAKSADLFVFAWKSSSHQAFYCVKDALGGEEPIWAPGKGTASILRAVLERLG